MFSTTATWNCRGSSRIAKNDSSVLASSVSSGGSRVSTEAGQRRIHRLAEQRDRPVEHPEGDEDADRQKRQQLDDRFRGDREHQAVLMLGRVDMARAEQHREQRHRQRDIERHVAEQRPADARRPAWRAR